MRIISWNINGIRAAIKKGLWPKIKDLQADIVCLQEIKCDTVVMQNILDSDLSGYSSNFDLIFSSAINRKGYSGTSIFFRTNSKLVTNNLFDQSNSNFDCCQINLLGTFVGMSSEFDVEGRINGFLFEFAGQKIALINGYYPQGGRVGRIEYKINFYTEVAKLVQKLQQEDFEIILCGDFNTTFGDLDLARPKENRQTTGCLPIEREALNGFINLGLVDIFRHFNPNQGQIYTYWDQITRARERNVGWRIDMFLVQRTLLPLVQKTQVHMEIEGSDHCPVSLDLGN